MLALLEHGLVEPAVVLAGGRVRFDGALMTIETPASPLPECRTGVYEVRVIRFGAQPVGLHYSLVQDACEGRVSDLSQVLPYVGPDN